jgi:hypothetical protein
MRGAVSYFALLAGLMAAASTTARAAETCGNIVSGEHAFAGSGEICTAPGGVYNPTATGTTILPFNDPGYGFVTYAGGQLSSKGAVTIATSAASASAVRSTGADSLTTLASGAVLSTSGAGAVAVLADSGGAVSLSAPVATAGATERGGWMRRLSVSTTGAQAAAVEAISGGTITLTGGLVSASGADAPALASIGAGSHLDASGVNAQAAAGPALSVRDGGAMTFDGGKATTTGPDLSAAAVVGGGSLTLSNASVIAEGAGSNAVLVQGAGSAVTATNASLSALGGADKANAAAGLSVVGGAARLTTSTILVGGGSAFGVSTTQGGSTTLVGGSVTASQDDRLGGAVYAGGGGRVSLQGVELSAAGDGAATLLVQGGAATTLGGTNLTIASTGGVDAATGALAGAVVNAGATGGGDVQLSNSTISTTGRSAIGVLTGDSGATTITGGSIATSGLGAVATQTQSGGALTLSGAQITTSGDGAKALSVLGAGSTLSGSNLVVSTTGTVETATGRQANALYNGNGAGGSTGGGTVTLIGSALSTSGDHANGAVTENGGATTLSGGSVTTKGVRSDAVFGSSGGAVTLVGERLTTSGDGAKGVDIEGTGTRLTGSGLIITTSGTIDSATGFHAQGVYNGSSTPASAGQTGGGIVNLVDSSVTTHGASSFGVDTANGGSTTFVGGSISTSGSGAVALLASDGASVTVGKDRAGQGTVIATTGASAAAVATSGAASVSIAGATITTAGAGSAGGVAQNAGALTLASVSIATAGDNASALYNGPGATGTSGGAMTLTNVVATTSGAGAYGLLTDSGGRSSATGGGFATTGADSTAVLTLNAGQTQLESVALSTKGDGAAGLVMNGAGGDVSAAHLTIATSGGVSETTGSHADGVYDGAFGAYSGGGTLKLVDSTVTTSGEQAYGVSVGAGGTTTVLGGAVTTSGEGAQGLRVAGGGSLTVGIDAAGAATVVATSGAGAPGAAAFGGGALTLTGTRIESTGSGAVGLVVSDAGTTVAATGVTIAASQGVGVYNGASDGGTSGGKLTLTNSNVAATAAFADALQATAGGVTTITGGGLTASGDYAAAAHVVGAASLSVSGAALVSKGGASAGLIVTGSGASVGVVNSTIADSGDGAAGEAASFAVFNGGAGEAPGNGALTITDSKLSVSGADAVGLFTGAQATTTVYGGSISASGPGSAALVAGGGTTTLAADKAGEGVAISTTAASSTGVLAYNGASLTMTGGAIATLGDGAAGLAVQDGETTVALANTTITTKGGYDSATGETAYGVYNGAGSNGSSGGSLTLDNVRVATTGDQAFALLTEAGGTTTATGGDYSTSGAGAAAAVARNGGLLTLSGASLSSTGQGAYGAAAVAGGALRLGDGVDISTSGAGAHGLYVADAGSQAEFTGAATIKVSGAGAAGIYVDSGGAAGAEGPLTVNAATYGLYINGYKSDAIGQTAIGLAGPLTLKTTDPSGAAITLSGNYTTFAGAGGGVIDAAGTAIAFLDGGEQYAAFANYEINAPQIVFADPASATVVFDNTTANAGTGYLANVVGGSSLSLSALASSLTGLIQTQAGSTTNVTLAGGSNWTITGNSTVTNLALVNSSAGFAPTSGGVFHTLTVTNFLGQNGALTFNADLGGANPGADKLIINGGQATGSTTINIRPVGNVGAATAGVPLVVTANGGSIASGAFTLSGPVTVGGYTYSLQSQNGGEYLVSSQALSPGQASGSLSSLAQSKQSQAITSRVLTSILTGATEQINCSSCSSGFASFGSFALGVHGRWTLSPSLELLAGASYDSYSAEGVTVNNSLVAALGLRYDMVQLGHYRPFFEAGIAVSPYANVSYSRGYVSSSGAGSGAGDTLSRSAAAYGRAGYIWRMSPIDEAAAYASYTRSWQSTGGYLEGATAGNPFGALVLPALDTMNIAEAGAQYTHLFGEHIEANISAGYAVAFGANYASDAEITGFGPASGVAPASFSWAELGGRLSYRFSKSVIADAFALGTVGAEPAGNQIHGGLALRMEF